MKYSVIIALSLLTFAPLVNAQSLTVASYNIRYENKEDVAQGNGWAQRGPVIGNLIQFNDFDVVGMQEVLNHQLTDLLAMLPDYDSIGVGRDDGKKKGEYSPILYKKNKFKLLQSGHFWLSTTTDQPNKGWDADFPRICTWAQFQENDSGLNFWFFNLHMDHHGVVARSESAKLVLSRINEMCGKEPVILTGDFNVDQNSESYKVVTESGVLKDSYEITEVRYVWNGTSPGFNPNAKTEARIDHVFVSSSWKVKRYGVLTDTYRSSGAGTSEIVGDTSAKKRFVARMPSDHFPVKVILEYIR